MLSLMLAPALAQETSAPATRPSEASPIEAPSAGATPVDEPAVAGGATPEVVVTANRLETPTRQVGSSISIISGDEIRRRQLPLVADVLRTTPGLDVARSGGANQITSVFTRGSESSHTLVLIDGVEANDPSSPNRAVDLSALGANNIERIEVLRGPQSTLWGSNAMGGVINIITKRGEGKPSGYAFGEYGSYNTFREGFGFSGASGAVDYSFSAQQLDTEGFSAAAERFGATEDDGASNTSLSGRVGWNVSERLNVDFIARYVRARADIDDFGGPGGDDPDRVLNSDNAFFRVQPRLSLLDGRWEQTFGFSYSYFHRDDNDETFPDEFDGDILRFDWQNDLKLSKDNTLTFGLDLAEERSESETIDERTADRAGIFIQDSATFGDRLFLTAGVRYDDVSISESAFTYRVTGAYLFPTDTKLRASYGTGFKAPSLSNIYSSFGSLDLEPERVNGFDVGVEQAIVPERLTVEATYFHNDFDNLIDFNFVTSRLENVGETTTQGVELGLTWRPSDTVAMGVSYTYTDTLNTETDQELLRRAPHKVAADVTWRYVPRGEVTLTAAYVSSRADIDPVTFGRSSVGDYTLVNLSTSYQVTDNLAITGRIENLLDQDYEEVAGFGTAGISFFGGLRLSF